MSTSELLDSIANSVANLLEEIKRQSDLLESLLEAMEQLHKDNEEKMRLFKESQTKEKTEITMEKIASSIPAKIREKLVFEEDDEEIRVKPQEFLGRDDFRTVASTIRELGGEYISAGRSSYFRVPRK